MQRVAVKIPRAVKPRLVVESGYVNHQRLSLPTAEGLSHPGIHRRRPGIFQVDIARRTGVLVSDQNLAGALQNSERLRDVSGARYSRQVALDLRIPGQPVRL